MHPRSSLDTPPLITPCQVVVSREVRREGLAAPEDDCTVEPYGPRVGAATAADRCWALVLAAHGSNSAAGRCQKMPGAGFIGME